MNSHNENGSTSTNIWDIRYEWKAVTLLCLGFGLVGIDRFMIMPLFPVMAKDLNLTYEHLGWITGSLAIAWGISAIFMGNLSDKLGHRKVIIPAIIAFSLLAGISGLATSVFMLIMIRSVMGFAEGAYTPSSIVATMDASKPERQGRNVGIQQAALPFFGLGIAPILVTQLLKIVEWHWVFAFVCIPGLIVAALLYRHLRDTPKEVAKQHTANPDLSNHKWSDVFAYRNIRINIITMLCWLTTLVVLSALLPNYLIDYLKLSIEEMGYIMSAIGFGGTLGTITMPMLSDYIGRRRVAIISTLCASISLYAFMNTGADTLMLFIYLAVTLFFIFSLITLTVGPISVEAVPAKLMATASGVVVGVGEIFGGGVAPIIAGTIATNFGIQFIMHLALGALILGFVCVFFLEETAPRLIK
ncbi:MFS transporter [Neptunomonas sp.]|uniref:MFS transporter n=1 Tax=Neptunomonas TaxID=75687 RepID=UPI00351810B7